MKSRIFATAALAGCMLVLGSAQNLWAAEAPAEQSTATAGSLITGGQPSEDTLHKLHEQGVARIINLRGPDETLPFDEQAAAEELGMEYVSLPIAGAADINREQALKLDALLQEEDDATLLHCASGNRVGALLALRAFYVQDKSAEDAIAIGKAAGMTSLEPRVREILQTE